MLTSTLKRKSCVQITPREEQVLLQISFGLTTKEIASRLFISDNNIISHRKNLLDKLDAKNVANMIRRAFEVGVLDVNADCNFNLSP